jgi:UDP-N-acetylglucosamine:LPS N-acetylglucosamine transferase
MLAQVVSAILDNRPRRAEMGRYSQSLGQPEAAERIVDACRELVGHA